MPAVPEHWTYVEPEVVPQEETTTEAERVAATAELVEIENDLAPAQADLPGVGLS